MRIKLGSVEYFVRDSEGIINLFIDNKNAANSFKRVDLTRQLADFED